MYYFSQYIFLMYFGTLVALCSYNLKLFTGCISVLGKVPNYSTLNDRINIINLQRLPGRRGLWRSNLHGSRESPLRQERGRKGHFSLTQEKNLGFPEAGIENLDSNATVINGKDVIMYYKVLKRQIVLLKISLKIYGIFVVSG